MKRLSFVVAIAALVSMGSAHAAPAHAGGQGKSQGPHAKTQGQAKSRAEHQVREGRDEAKGKATRAEEQVRTRQERAGDSAGPEQKAEMQARSQERKQIKEEYQTARRSGEGEKVKGQKPWWKFWASDSDDG